VISATIALLAAFATPARATEGYFSHGYGTHFKGLAGPGAHRKWAGVPTFGIGK